MRSPYVLRNDTTWFVTNERAVGEKQEADTVSERKETALEVLCRMIWKSGRELDAWVPDPASLFLLRRSRRSAMTS